MSCLYMRQLRLSIPKNISAIFAHSYKKDVQCDLLSNFHASNQSKPDLNKQWESIQNEISKLEAQLNDLRDLKREVECERSKINDNNFQEPWSSTEFPWSQEMQVILKKVFKKDQLTSNQLQAINATMSRKDVLVVMPTGAGKSLCYQLPALLSSGITIIISPLISLMEDQVLLLKSLDVSAQMVHSQSSLTTLMEVQCELERQRPSLKLLFVTPERMANPYFLPKLHTAYRQGNIARIALDEVHCVEEWGNSFRPNYKNMGILKQQFPDVPLLGVTATATPKILSELQKNLCVPNALLFTSFYPRNNLYYEVRNKPSSYKELVREVVDIIHSHFPGKSGIIYCFSRANCKSLCDDLLKNDIKAAPYHSTMSHKQKKEVHMKWLSGEIQVICATNAFGMGINKQDVRFVIHQTMSKNMETYYQESGRAGRDGLPALCLLYYGFADAFQNVGFLLKQRMGLKRLDSVIRYSPNANQCRHQVIAKLFEVESGPCEGKCDVCSGSYEYHSCDVSSTCQTLMSFVQSFFKKGRPLTGPKLVQAALKSSKNDHSREELQIIVMQMLIAGYLRIEPHVFPIKNISYIVPGPQSSALYRDKISVWLRSEKTDSIAKCLSS